MFCIKDDLSENLEAASLNFAIKASPQSPDQRESYMSRFDRQHFAFDFVSTQNGSANLKSNSCCCCQEWLLIGGRKDRAAQMPVPVRGIPY